MCDFDDTDLPLPPPPPPPTEEPVPCATVALAPAVTPAVAPASAHKEDLANPEQQMTALETTCRLLFKEDYFAFLIHLHMKNILKDGKVDLLDVPDILAILVELLQRQPKLKVTADDLPEVLRVLFHVVLEQFDVHVPALEQAQLLRLLESSARLVLLRPAVKESCNTGLAKLKACWCF